MFQSNVLNKSNINDKIVKHMIYPFYGHNVDIIKKILISVLLAPRNQVKSFDCKIIPKHCYDFQINVD